LKIPEDALVVTNVGSLRPEKNHLFLIELFAKIAELVPDARLILVGDGPLKSEIETAVRSCGFGENILMLGQRDDVPRILLGATDVLVMTSHHEGLPLAGIEAQAAGVPCVFSNAITRETDAIPSLISRRALEDGATEWARTVIEVANRPRLERPAVLEELEQSTFNIEKSIDTLLEIYEEI